MAAQAEGGYAAPLPRWSTETFDKEGAEDPVQQPPNPRLGPDGDNIVQRVDVTKIANDEPNDHDYDDPYPGGPTKSIPVETGG